MSQGRQLMIDHYMEMEACPDDVYGSNILQDGQYSDNFESAPFVVDPSGSQTRMGVS